MQTELEELRRSHQDGSNASVEFTSEDVHSGPSDANLASPLNESDGAELKAAQERIAMLEETMAKKVNDADKNGDCIRVLEDKLGAALAAAASEQQAAEESHAETKAELQAALNDQHALENRVQSLSEALENTQNDAGAILSEAQLELNTSQAAGKEADEKVRALQEELEAACASLASEQEVCAQLKAEAEASVVAAQSEAHDSTQDSTQAARKEAVEKMRALQEELEARNKELRDSEVALEAAVAQVMIYDLNRRVLSCIF